MGIGEGIQAGFVLLCLLTALRPPIPRRGSAFDLGFLLSFFTSEQPILTLAWLLVATTPGVARGNAVAIAVTAVAAVAVTIILVRARTARPALEAALSAAGVGPLRTPPPWWRILLLPIVSYRPDVRRLPRRRYGPARRGNLLDLYLPRHPQGLAPLFVYVHGGALRTGSRLLGARPLFYRLASAGWAVASIDHRLLRGGVPADGPQQDVRAAIEWLADHAAEFGADGSRVVLAGSSSGAGLMTAAALTPDLRVPVAGVIGFYGYWGSVPLDRATPVPLLMMHGSADSLVPARDARAFAERARAAGVPVTYAELPYAQHSFDMFHSWRTHAVVDAAQAYAEHVRVRADGVRADPPLSG